MLHCRQNRRKIVAKRAAKLGIQKIGIVERHGVGRGCCAGQGRKLIGAKRFGRIAIAAEQRLHILARCVLMRGKHHAPASGPAGMGQAALLAQRVKHQITNGRAVF